MLNSRTYKPKKDELIYHYCTAETFNSICSNKTIRLCDIFSMNDYLEMHWGYSIWEKAAAELLPEFGEEFIDAIDQVLHLSSLKCLVLASCFSLDGDVLSQWRAYADDGNGYVIGFNAKDLLKLTVRPLKVQYNEKRQIHEVKAFIKALHYVESTEEYKFGGDFVNACSKFAFDLASYKNPVFSEEKEVRLVHLLNFEESNDSLKLTDEGGTYFGKHMSGQDVKFTITQNAPKAYLDINFTDFGTINPIKEVIIGPKNLIRSTAISVYLETLNLGNVNVKRSLASYR
jgi:hypothetical protein